MCWVELEFVVSKYEGLTLEENNVKWATFPGKAILLSIYSLNVEVVKISFI